MVHEKDIQSDRTNGTRSNLPQKTAWKSYVVVIFSLIVFGGCSAKVEPATPETTPSFPAGEVREFAGIEFVWIPSGTFMMGSDHPADDGDQQPVHEVEISKGFWFAKTEMTQRDWKRLAGVNPSEIVGDDLPVNCVSWLDCQAFLEELNAKGDGVFRLPTEAEWEYACRAGGKQRYPFQEEDDLLDDYAWHVDNSGQTLHPVGLKAANPFGLHDMSGNVSEWCYDVYQGYGSNEKTVDPNRGNLNWLGERMMRWKPQLFPRVCRGGSYDWIDGCTCTLRDYYSYTYRSPNIGVRLVRQSG